MVIVIGTFAISQSCSIIAPIKGNGNLITSEKTVSAFEKISNTGSAEVRFHASEGYRVVITVDENLDEYVEISTENNVLNIGTKRNSNCSFTKFLVDVYCPVITSVSITGSGNFGGNIECDNFTANITGSGNITVSGKSENANIVITGSGNFSGNEFYIKDATVRITGSSSANICVEDNLKATITGSGGINYRGEPKVESKVTGSGKIKKI